jgi:hypothetical protein
MDEELKCLLDLYCEQQSVKPDIDDPIDEEYLSANTIIDVVTIIIVILCAAFSTLMSRRKKTRISPYI